MTTEWKRMDNGRRDGRRTDVGNQSLHSAYLALKVGQQQECKLVKLGITVTHCIPQAISDSQSSYHGESSTSQHTCQTGTVLVASQTRVVTADILQTVHINDTCITAVVYNHINSFWIITLIQHANM